MTRRVAWGLLVISLLIWTVVAFAAGPTARYRYQRIAGTAVLLPDPVATPGEVDPTLTREQACRPERLRKAGENARRVPHALRAAVFAAYGIPVSQWRRYELDHRVPVKLEGKSTAKNLWPQAYAPTPGAHEKDRLELAVIRAVCVTRTMTLAEGQAVFLERDWFAAYRAMFR